MNVTEQKKSMNNWERETTWKIPFLPNFYYSILYCTSKQMFLF
jgi:hypothetical protein